MSTSNESIKFLDSAIAGHIKWRTRLNDCAAGKEQIDPAVACRDDACPLGKWIYGEGKDFSGFPQFGEVKGKHAEFHRCAGEIAGQICAGDVETAKKTLAGESSPFSRATAATVDAIQALRSAIHDKDNRVFRWNNLSIRSKLFIGCGVNMALMFGLLLLALFSATAKETILSLFAVALAVSAALTFFLGRALTLPAERMREIMAKVAASGDLSVRIESHGGDEIGRAMVAFNDMLDMLQTAVLDVNHVVTAVANGVFSERIILNARGDFKIMKDAVNRSADSVQVSMEAIGTVMKALYNGDFSQRVSADVKGEFKQAVDQAMQAMQAMLGDVGKVMSSVSDGDLSRRVSAEGRGDLARLKEDINASLTAMSKALTAVAGNTQQVAAASDQTSSAIGQISDGAQNQMHAINQVASAVQQTAASVTDVAKAAESANSRAQSMGLTVNESMADMNRMVDIVQTIAANADRIDKITDVIEKIANKTNLLSLNAAIEAARAGEHGKGFAVVAEEVGKLAASAAESTQEITALVKQAVEDADRASETVTVVNKGMQGIAQGARQTEAELQRISAAMEQQNAAITEINANVGSLNKIASANASAAEEITATVMELARLADGTRREVARFSM